MDNIEAPKQRLASLEERASRALELIQEIPLSVQVVFMNRVSLHIERLDEDRWESPERLIAIAAPALEQITEAAVEESDPEILSKVGRLSIDILGRLRDTQEKRNQLVTQVGEGLEKIADETENWELFSEAAGFYKKIDQTESLQRIANKLEEVGERTADWEFLNKAGELYQDLRQDQQVQRVAANLKKAGEELSDSALLASAGRLLGGIYERREEAVRLLLAGGKVEEAADLAGLPGTRISKELQREVGNRSYEARKAREKEGLFSHQELLQGKGWRDDQVKAWLKEGNPQRALEIALHSDLVEQASEIIQKHNLQKEATRIIRGLEAARAVHLARSLKMPSELVLELANKASRCSNRQIEVLKQQIWLTQVKIENIEEKTEKEKLRKRLSAKQQQLIEAYLGQDSPGSAADYAEEIGEVEQAKDIGRKMLARLVENKEYRKAVEWAQRLGDSEAEYQLLIAAGNYNKALDLALKKEWGERLVELGRDHLNEISVYYGSLHNALLFLQERKEEIEQAEETSLAIAAYLKSYYEEVGRLLDAAEMGEILGLSELAATYRELNTLIPKPERRGCYITTACCKVMGLTDDCEVMTNLRWLRDNFISGLPNGQDLIAVYYDTAPQILERTSPEELKDLFHRAIKPASDLVKERRYPEAFELYKETLRRLINKYL